MSLTKRVSSLFVIVAAVLVLLAGNASASTVSFGDWNYLGYRTYPSYAEFYARTSILFDDHHMVIGSSNVHSGIYDWSTGTWSPVIQNQAGMMRASVQLYQNLSVVEVTWWRDNVKNSSLVTVSADAPGYHGDYYWADGGGRYFYQGNYYPMTTDDFNLTASPILLYPSGSSYAANSYQSAAAYLRACGLTEFKYGITDNGETYGSAILRHVFGRYPDWIMAIASNGEEGYIDANDYWVPEATCPADSIANYSVERTRYIPVYSEPGGNEIVGYLGLRYGGLGESDSN